MRGPWEDRGDREKTVGGPWEDRGGIVRGPWGDRERIV